MFPVEEKIGEIRDALAENKSVVLVAPPGSGKTTCVPGALLDEPWLAGRKIVMLEPRRIAARSCASFIARKLGSQVGSIVGYQVRLERKISRETRLEILTEGLLAQRLLSDPELEDVGLVVFDEFHERSLACDMAFALALEVRRALRDDLRILVMSATLDAAELADHLGDARVVRSEGRMFPVRTEYLGDVPVAAAVSKALRETDGDILCFLPGEGEIRRAEESLCRIDGAVVLPLYGSLAKEEQDRVFGTFPRRKVILATSIAETSLTIPGITCVIDSGLMRIQRFSPSTGMSALVTLPLSRDRAEQRRGRAGRVSAGVCYRLWDEGADMSRPPRMTPEILDADLSSLVLSSVSWGALKRDDLPWMTLPPASAWEQSTGLLKDLGALDERGCMTPKGERMSRMPMHPRLANMVLNSSSPSAALLAAIMEEGARGRELDIGKVSDEILETPDRPHSKRILKLARKFEKFLGGDGARSAGPSASEGAALALAYPDRIAKRRASGSYVMVSGKGAEISAMEPLAKSEYIVCCEIDGRAGNAKVFRAAPVSLAEIEELFGDRIVEEEICFWDRRNDSVKAALCRKLGQIVLSEKPLGANSLTDVASAMLEGVRHKGVANLPSWTKASLRLRERIAFVARHSGQDDLPWPAMTDEDILGGLEGFLSGMSKWRDLERLDMSAVMGAILSERGHDMRELDRLAPERMQVPSGSRLLVHYGGEEPTVEAKLQECFGLLETPKVLMGKVPVVMTLLSPAMRPVQITKDLAFFWKEGYNLVRKDLRGRYPKHYWPEDPFTATASRSSIRRN